MMTSAAKKNLLIIIILLCMLVLPSVMRANLYYGEQKTAYASVADYTMGDGNYRLKDTDNEYYNSEDGCSYIFTIREDANFPIQEIRYSAYQVSSEYDPGFDDEEVVNNDFAFLKNGDEMDDVPVEFIDDTIEFSPSGKRLLEFEITMYEWAAFTIDVHYKDNVTQEIFVETSDLIYCTLIDTSQPYISLYSNPVFTEGGYRFDFRVTSKSATNYRSADSGLNKVIVYRIIDEERETVDEYTSFTTRNMLETYLIAIKGEYFIEAYDNVGNHSEDRVIKLDKSVAELDRIAAVESVLNNAEEYREDLIENLRKKYVEWQFKDLNNDFTNSEVEDAEDITMEALRACSEAQRIFDTSIINKEYIDGEIEIENFNAENFPYTLRGEKSTLQITFGEFDTQSYNMNNILEAANMPSADKVLVIDIKTLSDIKEIPKTDFEEAIAITIPLENYKDIAGLLETQTESGRSFSSLTVDKGINWVKVYVPASEQRINLVIATKDSMNKNLYWLFTLLIIPLGIGLVLLRKKIFIYNSKKCDNKNEIKPANEELKPAKDANEIHSEKQSAPPKRQAPPQNKAKKKIKKKK